MTAAPPEAGARLRWMTRHVGPLVLALLLLVIAAGVAAYSFGLFSSTSANAENTVSTGTMTQVSSKPNEAILTATGMVPGDTATGSVSITNKGDASGEFVLTGKDLVDTPGPNGGKLSGVLRLQITDKGQQEPLYDGVVADFGSVPLGEWNPEEKRTYDFRVDFPSAGDSTDNRYQLSSTKLTFVWDATQAS